MTTHAGFSQHALCHFTITSTRSDGGTAGLLGLWLPQSEPGTHSTCLNILVLEAWDHKKAPVYMRPCNQTCVCWPALLVSSSLSCQWFSFILEAWCNRALNIRPIMDRTRGWHCSWPMSSSTEGHTPMT